MLYLLLWHCKNCSENVPQCYVIVQEGSGLLDMAGNFGYHRPGDTGAAILQKAFELSSSTTVNLLWPVAVLVKWTASSVWPLLCIFMKSTVLQENRAFLIFVNKQLDAQFFSYIFIPILYMFRTPLCSSSGESTVLIRHLVYVTLRRYAHLTVTYIEWHIPDVILIRLILLMMSTRVLETCRELE
jgi:hypothetical protein